MHSSTKPSISIDESVRGNLAQGKKVLCFDLFFSTGFSGRENTGSDSLSFITMRRVMRSYGHGGSIAADADQGHKGREQGGSSRLLQSEAFTFRCSVSSQYFGELLGRQHRYLLTDEKLLCKERIHQTGEPNHVGVNAATFVYRIRSLSIGKYVVASAPADVYSRLKQLEERVLELEQIVPIYQLLKLRNPGKLEKLLTEEGEDLSKYPILTALKQPLPEPLPPPTETAEVPLCASFCLRERPDTHVVRHLTRGRKSRQRSKS